MRNRNEKEPTLEHIKLCLNFIKGRYFISPINKGIESKNYLVGVNDKNNFKYILKIYSESNVEEVKYETEILDKLNFSVRKKYFPIILKKIFFIDKKPCILLKYIHGRILSKDDISSCLIKKIAQKQATIHRVFINYTPKHKKNRFSIFDFSFTDFYLNNKKNLYYNFLRNEIVALKKESKLFAKVKFKKSIIHEDLNVENIIVTKNSAVNFIDFGESHKAEVISDIATAIKEIIISGKGVNFGLIQDYLDSYQKIIRLNKDEINALLFLFKRRSIFMIVYLLDKQKINKNIDLRKKIATEMKTLKILQKNNYLIENFIKKYKYE